MTWRAIVASTMLGIASLVANAAGEKIDLRIHTCQGDKQVRSDSASVRPGEDNRFFVSATKPLRKVVLIVYRLEPSQGGFRLRARALRGQNDERVEELQGALVVLGKPTHLRVAGEAGESLTLTIEAYREGSAPEVFGGTHKCPSGR